MQLSNLSFSELGERIFAHAHTCPCEPCAAWAERCKIMQSEPARLGRRDLWAVVRTHQPICVCKACLAWHQMWRRAESALRPAKVEVMA